MWRLVTSTFLHFSVVHIALNLLAFYQLGTLLESWYGTHQFVMIYGLTGGGGNLISIWIRYWNGSSPRSPSAGGSVVIMGLVALRGRGLTIAHSDGKTAGLADGLLHGSDSGARGRAPAFFQSASRQLGSFRGCPGRVRAGTCPSQVTPTRVPAIGLGAGRGGGVRHRGLWSSAVDLRSPRGTSAAGAGR